ncbi:MAG TPA: hypothetical protein PLI77_01030 [Bacteroidales bacterium]|nr:hypothetical protein [Bacteroidales bacterium]
MDTKQIIILIIIIAVYLYNTIRKANAKARENQQDKTLSHEVDDEQYFEPETEPELITQDQYNYDSFDQIDYAQMLKNRQIIAESLETSTLKTENDQKTIAQKSYKKTPENIVQQSVNEEDNVFEISTDLDEVKRGFIFSEILKRKYN